MLIRVGNQSVAWTNLVGQEKTYTIEILTLENINTQLYAFIDPLKRPIKLDEIFFYIMFPQLSMHLKVTMSSTHQNQPARYKQAVIVSYWMHWKVNLGFYAVKGGG